MKDRGLYFQTFLPTDCERLNEIFFAAVIFICIIRSSTFTSFYTHSRACIYLKISFSTCVLEECEERIKASLSRPSFLFFPPSRLYCDFFNHSTNRWFELVTFSCIHDNENYRSTRLLLSHLTPRQFPLGA